MKLNKKTKIAAVFFSGLTLLCLAVILSFHFLNSYALGDVYSKLVDQSDDLQKYETEILSDLILLDEKPIFSSVTFDRNAMPFLEKYIAWQGRKGESQTVLSSLQTLLNKHPQLTSKEDFEALFADAALLQTDLSWFDEINQYDHLSTFSTESIRSEFDKMKNAESLERLSIYSELPVPQLKDLSTVAFIRFFQLAQKNETEQGFKLIRHLSHLFNTYPSVLGPTFAYRLLNAENTLKQMTNSSWEPIDDQRLMAYRSLSWVWPDVVNQYIWGKHFNSQIEKFMKPENGLCSVAGEKALGLIYYDFLEPKVLFEADFSVQVAHSRKIIESIFEKCHMSDYKFLLYVADRSGDRRKSAEKKVDVQKFPFIRKIIAINLLAVGTPSFAKFYIERSQKK